MHFDENKIRAAVFGGAVLGGGGGGALLEGLSLGNLACRYGKPRIISINELDKDDLIITVALVGAPAAEEQFIKPRDYVEAVRLLASRLNEEVKGIITNENGGMTTVNGFLQSAVLDIPVVDAPCNGRAHPVGSMGGMGLHKRPAYTTFQAACGGNPATFKHHRLLVSGPVSSCSSIIRDLAVRAGGMVAVARNPVSADYVRQNAAVGAIEQAVQVGESMLSMESLGPSAMVKVASDALSGEVTFAGHVVKVEILTEGGFDVGKVIIDAGGNRDLFELTFWNEYMTLEQNGTRLATFPDLIMTICLEEGTPITSASIKEGNKVAVITTDQENLLLGAGMYDRELYYYIEKAVSKEIVSFIEGRVFNA